MEEGGPFRQSTIDMHPLEPLKSFSFHVKWYDVESVVIRGEMEVK